MATYALPSSRGHTHGSHSYSGPHLSPAKAASGQFFSHGSVKKAVSNGSLYTHVEVHSPVTSPDGDLNQHSHAGEQNVFAFQHNAALHQHSHSYSHSRSPQPIHSHIHSHNHSRSPMRGRARGESDLGRPAVPNGFAYAPSLDTIPAASTSWFSLPEALTSLLIPLPYLLASAAYSSSSTAGSSESFPPLSAYARLQQSVLSDLSQLRPDHSHGSSVMTACSLTSATLLLAGALAKIQSSERVLDRRKDASSIEQQSKALIGAASAQVMIMRAFSVGLPFYASMQIGGMRTGLIMLTAISAGITCSNTTTRLMSLQEWKHLLSSRIATSVVLLACVMFDIMQVTISASSTNLFLGYAALGVSIFAIQPPLPNLTTTHASVSSSKPGAAARSAAASPLTCSTHDINIALLTGALLGVVSIIASLLLSAPISLSAIVFSSLSVGITVACIFVARPITLRSQRKVGLGLGCLLTASSAFLFSPSTWPGSVCNGGLSALAFISVLYDTASAGQKSHDDDDHVHTGHKHHHHTNEAYSTFTKAIMSRCEPGSVVHGILSEKDSRRIAYFTCLNFGFMFVQGVYGWLSGSLGLLSDTVHMFFDCLGLVIGLGAAVASKWPTCPERPYGWGKLNTLAGFGNGIFLMLVSVEFIWEAIEGIMEKKQIRRVEELLVVSTLGLLVNMVGLFAFGHAHAGHDHGGHSHGEPHSHDHHDHHSHTHANGNLHDRSDHHGHGHDHSPAHSQPPKVHDHHEHNENMHGIYLHVAADAGGSLAVITSTAMTLWRPWYLWDPIATIIIAILIFVAAVPLVVSSGRKLLLVIPEQLDYTIKNTLQELGEMRGVVGYAVPRFWVDDKDEAGDSHGHHHGHDHGAADASKPQKVLGVIHVIAAKMADAEDVRQRVDDFLQERSMDVVIHVEREGEGQCWCGGGSSKIA